MSTKLTLSSLLLATVPAVLAQSTGSGSCSDVHLIIARGWNENYPGRQGALTSAVCADLPGMSCDYEDVAYDAYSTDYCPSVAAGQRLALQKIDEYVAKCPNSAIVLSGYSEGATVIGNVLAGESSDPRCPDTGFSGMTRTAAGASCNIAAVTLWGNPRHTANQPYNALTGGAGQATETRDAGGLARLNFYTPRLQDYCSVDDLVCAPGLGANTVEAHTNYFDYATSQAAQYIASAVKGYSKDKYCSVASSSSSSAASSTASVSSSAAVSVSSSAAVSASTSAAASVSASGNATLPSAYTVPSAYSAPSAYSSPASVPYITATEVNSIYTTVCPQSSIYSNGNMTRTSTWTGPSTVTTSLYSTATITVPASYVPSPSPVKESAITTINGTPAVVQYTSTITVTKYLNFPTMTITLTVPTATQWIGGQGASNGTIKATGTGAGSAKPTGSSAPITPFEGAASSSGVAAKFLAIAAGVAGLMMI